MGKLSKDRRDIYYRKAKENGYRARSSYKLIQINEKFEIFKLFDPNIYNKNKNELINIYNENFCYNVVDLCAAPGSWSQVLKNICLYNYYQILYFINKDTDDIDREKLKCLEYERFMKTFSLYINFNNELENKINELKKKELIKEPKIIAVDLQEIGNMKYVDIIQGDITKLSTIEKILKYMNNKNETNNKENTKHEYESNINKNNKIINQTIATDGFSYANTVVSDGAPDITGMNDIDEFIQSQLILSSLKVCCSVLKIGGNFISKIFRGEHTGLLVLHLNKFFERVYICKPQSSRNKSLEAFLVCLNFSLPLSNIVALSNSSEKEYFNNRNLTQEQIRKIHTQFITKKDHKEKFNKKNNITKNRKKENNKKGAQEENNQKTADEDEDESIESDDNKDESKENSRDEDEIIESDENKDESKENSRDEDEIIESDENKDESKENSGDEDEIIESDENKDESKENSGYEDESKENSGYEDESKDSSEDEDKDESESEDSNNLELSESEVKENKNEIEENNNTEIKLKDNNKNEEHDNSCNMVFSKRSIDDGVPYENSITTIKKNSNASNTSKLNKNNISSNDTKHKNMDIFNFYCSDSDEEIKYFNSEDEEIVNNYIASKTFKNCKLFSFVATQNYYDSDKSYLLPQNYVRHEPQLMPLKPPYLLSLQKKRQETKKL